MKIIGVIESRRWINRSTGHTASIYGAVPYINEADAVDWSVETVGWTWKRDDGCVGLCRPPAKTYDEAVAVMKKINGQHGMTTLGAIGTVAGIWAMAMLGVFVYYI